MRHGWLLGGVALLIGTLMGVSVAQAQYYGQNKVQYRLYDWRSITSDHFEVYYYSGLDSLAIRVMDLAEKTNATLTRRMGHTLGHRVPIILYGSHNDFAQTNVTPELIDAGTGGFTELLRNRVVLPFTGSYEDLRHVVVHELVHAYMFDLIYGGNATALLARQSFFQVPLWFAEGLAEYISLDIEPNAEMFMRDGAITGYVRPLTYTGGYLVYKQGQLAIAYLVERHGEDRLRELLQKTRQMRSFDRAFQRAVGMPIDKFDEQFRAWLRKRFWPTVSSKEDPELFARRLTDHRRDESNLNTAPAISPQGDRIAYFSDRRQYTDVYIMSAFDGKVLNRVIRGERSVQFEAIPSFRSSLTWSPQGDRIGLTAKSEGRDVLYLVSAKNGKVLKRFDLDCDALTFPAWSPVSDSLVVVGLKDGRSDLWLVDAGSGAVTRLTDDTYDEKQPTWTPDGRSLTFASDRLAPVVLQPLRQERGYGAYGLFSLELTSRQSRLVLDTHGDDHSPAWSPDGRKLAFVSDRSGGPDIYLFDPADSSITQLTEVQGGVTSLSWSRQNDRLVFSAFNRGGFDVFAVKEPLSLDAVVDRLKRQAPQTVLSVDRARRAADEAAAPTPPRGALAGAWPDSVTTTPDTLASTPRESEPAVVATGTIDTVRAEPPSEVDDRRGQPPPWGMGNDHSLLATRDTVPRLPTRTPLVERGGPFALPDSLLRQEPHPYRVRLAPDYAGGGFYAASGIGFVGSTQFQFSDFLGNHNLFIASDVFSNSFDETNAIAIYNYLPRRWDVGGGLFHFKNYFSSRVTTLGEQLSGPRLFSERTYGALLSAAYPFNRFRRAEFNFTQMFVEREFFDRDPFGFLIRSGTEFRSVTSPSISLVGDNALFGYYGPVNGQRYNLSYSPSLALFDNGLNYHTFTYDGRRYWDLTHGYTFAARALGGVSTGRDPQTFRVGGFSTLRGYPDFDLLGSRLAIVNAELRFPFIQQLGLVGPVPLGIFNLRGAVFADAGVVWNGGEEVRLTRSSNGKLRLEDTKLGFGTGIRTAFYFFIVKLDAAWNTDFVGVSRPRWHFSIGPEF
ncbi:MAG TPA: BamA/TamA family outer membrane protein [Candidatus Limnocylindria bacterium]|nr:BamA/TamA family outer membrane protein [Candidatus Limnocylindria bacterium]